jgi:SAM-dependent methyltransferase
MFPQLYARYYTQGGTPPQPSAASRAKAIARQAVLSAAYGYAASAPAYRKVLGAFVSLIPGVRDTVGSSVRWLRGERRGRLLDVGCGGGDFLVQMRSLGWDVAGIEPDAVAAEQARTRRNLAVETGTPETSNLAAATFDVITLNHVIEHVPDPIATLRASAPLLRAGGTMVIVTPNVDSLGGRVFGSAWMHWDPPRHLFLFSRDTLRTCVSRAGLSLEHVRTPAQGVRPAWGTSRLIRHRGRVAGEAYRHRSWLVKLEEAMALLAESLLVTLRQPVGEEIVLFAGKPS